MSKVGAKHPETQPIGGMHHCVGTAGATVEWVFRQLREICLSRGGHLTDDDLEAARTDLMENLESGFDFFESVHQRCMVASRATAPMMLTRGKMLSALLAVCTRGAAAHAFAVQIDHLGGGWLDTFYPALSKSLQRHVVPDAEKRLAAAYVGAGGKLRQDLTIEKMFSEKPVQDVVWACILPFEKMAASNAMVAQLNIEINDYVSKKIGNGLPHISKITVDQTLKFLNLAPHEAYLAMRPQRVFNVGGVTADGDPERREESAA